MRLDGKIIQKEWIKSADLNEMWLRFMQVSVTPSFVAASYNS